ncbi:MAG: CDP-alcohol phosphatidyltransferase family protein [Kofleriaceae bacterium]|nr:CDP-alcohol phosphatidyltransferase family protein [Kofleriaceae bacterium]
MSAADASSLLVSAPLPCDVMILLDPALATVKVCGLTIAERARRVALRCGAERIWLLEHAAVAVPAWLHSVEVASDATAEPRSLLIIDCTTQIIHMPLLQPLLNAATGTVRIAVDPVDGQVAGALWCAPTQRAAIMAQLLEPSAVSGGLDGPSIAVAMAAYSRKALARIDAGNGIVAVPHGAIARHPAVTPSDRKAAIHFLFGLVRKAQDTWLIRTVNRRVSYPFTRLLLPTTISPNMISIAVFIIGAIGCWVLAQPTYQGAVVGTLLVLFAGYLDGCDGEIARIRLESSKLGAWIDTIADEVTTVLFLIGSGLHVYRKLGEPWIGWSIVIGTVGAMLSIYIIYYYLIVVAHSGNSQDYPSSQGGIASALRVLVQRNIINVAAVAFALFNRIETLYFLTTLGGIVTAVILIPDHIALRWKRRRSTT